MSVIFDSIKTRNLDQVYEINLNQYYRHLYSENLENAVLDDAPFVVRIASGINHPHMNAVLQTDIKDNFEKIFEKSKSIFSSRALPFTWYIIPSSKPDDLKDLLEIKDLRYIGDDVILGVELEDMVRNISSPNSLYIEAIDSYEKLEIWIDIYSTQRNIKGNNIEMYKEIFKDVDFNDKNHCWRKYIGWLNGEPVAASTLVIAGGVATTYDESLLPKFKGWGIEDAINLVPLKEARTMGYRLGLVPTSVGGIKRFTGIGFTELFSVKKMVYHGDNRRNRGRRR